MAQDRSPLPAVAVPLGYPTAVIFMDESGSKASQSRFFVMGALKVRRPGELVRALRAVRDRTGFESEFKFADLTRGALVPYYEAIEAIASSDAHVAATVVNREVHDPFPGKSVWEAHADVAVQLLVGCMNVRELVTVLLDGISTPEGVAFDETVRERANKRLKAASVVGALCIDSKCSDGLQMADLVASAIAFERRRAAGERRGTASNPNSPKAKVARRLLDAFGISSVDDTRTSRVNIATLRPKRSPARPLRVAK